MTKFVSLILILIFFCCTAGAREQWDWHIAGGMIVDGTGKPAYRADILIRSDTIGFIGQINADTVEVKHHINASGKVITPGFIDVHAHGNPKSTPKFLNFLAMGVTTIVLGQDGSSPGDGPLAVWFKQVADAHPAVNIATLSGHGSIRSQAGAGKTRAGEQELRRMEDLLEAELRAGSFGMSTGLEYVPGLYADEKELQRLAAVVGEYNGIVMSHMRSEDDGEIEKSLDELAAQGKSARVHASHLKVVYGEGAERAVEILRYIEKFRERGIEFSADTYPYTASYTGISIVFPVWAKTESEWQQALKERPDMLRQYLSDKVERRNGPGAILFGSGPYTGKTLKEVAIQQARPYVEVLLEMGPGAASAAHFVMDEELQDRIAIAPDVMISSDGSPTMHHPRGYGSFARVIHRYVIRQQRLTIEQAVYKMSGLPAQTLGIDKRGIIKEGYKADLLIFDLEEVRDVATYEQPHQLAKGFDWIWVNGSLVRKDGRFTGKRSGKVIKKR